MEKKRLLSVTGLLLPLRFRTKKTCWCRFAFAQKRHVAAASLSHKKDMLLPLRLFAINFILKLNLNSGD
ncbi:hypothetical protein [Lysinibacillus xylanilyticus]|uniref:Uncharacterized protein n=1 Tax=Lysinibacillus xylanilyticus TaxID=582475 RepID=A0ABT4EIC7_9BACI|nr:hypothetical protein [Lysinibacillus xylanilyticus]MCY9545372.1 hypothetical protein [Lysinibacillus xylanilyticus]